MSGAFNIAELPWQEMETAPRDGTIIAVRFHDWNVDSNPPKIQFVQWINVGAGGKFCAPFDPNSEPYADAWVSLSALNIAEGAVGEGQ